ncbi:MAG: flagellar basal body rod protein FlgB [Spirochaetales bacterium]|uniref:Flagellar basal body rod protein FlgB n=1 Tax=Candidatus Thalassospirochaeta sargassi TaxID=3119039 RepID=A0AAJ1IID8_9SPIO|nr:flagellar basal body rod protein FlgB [Spirochaetales bacterium]
MFLDNSFGKDMELLHRTMDANLYRRSVISDNLANADTPNFKRSVVNFESELKRALDSENQSGMEAAMTDSKHISFNKVQDWREVQPRKVLDYLTKSDNNGNNVDAEEELMLAMQNQLQYNLLTTSISNQFYQISKVTS